MLRALILIVSEPGFQQKITKEVVKIKGVKEAFSVFGRYDIAVLVETENHDEMSNLSETLISLSGVKKIEALVGFNPTQPRRIVDPELSYKFVMSISPYLLKGVSMGKWITFLNKLEAARVRVGEAASKEVLQNIGTQLELKLEQMSKINCTKKCLELFDQNALEFKACINRCRRTGDP